MNRCFRTIFLGLAASLMAVAAAQAGDNDWVRVPAKTYFVHAVRIENVAGTLTIDVKDGGPTQVEINGIQWKVDRTVVRQSAQELSVVGSGKGGAKVWDWRSWFDFHQGDDNTKNLYVHLIVSKGTAVKIVDQIGNAVIGNTEGPMNFSAVGRTDSHIGKVSEASISLAGSGKIQIGDVTGRLEAETAGSGNIRAGDACDVHAEIAGSGSISVGKARCALHVEIAGSGDFMAGAVAGATSVEIAGSGSVNIAEGEANPLHVEIMGSGNVNFGGTAVDPHIESMGSGSVRLKAYRGNLRKEGNSNLRIGK